MAVVNPITTPTSGNVTAQNVTITYPSYSSGDALLLAVGRNQQGTFSASGNITTLSTLSNVDTGRLAAFWVTPSTTYTGGLSFTLNTGNAQVNGWWFANYGQNWDSTSVAHAENAIGASSSSTITIPSVTTSSTTGSELCISIATTNSTATWTTDGNTVYNTTTGNATLMVDSFNPSSGLTSVTFASMDRGNNGSSRNQNSLALVIKPVGGSTPNPGQFFALL